MEFSQDLHEGKGAAYFRCLLCGRPVSPLDLDQSHGCAHCGHTRIRPSDLTLWEKVLEVLRNPKILKYAGK